MLKHPGLPRLNPSLPLLPISIRPVEEDGGSTSSLAPTSRTAPSCFCLRKTRVSSSLRVVRSAARRRSVRYGSEDEEEDGEDEEYGHNEEIAMLETYTQSARGEALIVHAVVDNEEVQVLIFKGFSSSLSYGTSPDPSKSILPAKAEIRSIDRVKGPFDPSNIQYIEKDLSWKSFVSNFIVSN